MSKDEQQQLNQFFRNPQSKYVYSLLFQDQYLTVDGLFKIADVNQALEVIRFKFSIKPFDFQKRPYTLNR